ncbi:hypothetical protein AB9K41_11535 [Cribrihabitans sp. XS_ASV171]
MRLVTAALATAFLSSPALAQSNDSGFGTRVHPDHGRYIVDPQGRPVYAMITEGEGTDGLSPLRSCKQRCLTDWPFVTAADTPKAGARLDQALFDLVSWEGQDVVHYNGWTLFHFAMEDGDDIPDGHAISTYGGWWALVTPEGDPIRTGVMPGANEG